MRDPPAPLHLDALIQPNRSLSRRGMWVVLGLVGLFNGLIAIFLLMIRAYPVPFFLGLDLLGVVVAFNAYGRQAHRCERVRVDADRITVSYEPPRKRFASWSSPTAFTRIQLEADERGSCRLLLRASGRFIAVGQVLGEDERARLAARLTKAVAEALAERHAWPQDPTPGARP